MTPPNHRQGLAPPAASHAARVRAAAWKFLPRFLGVLAVMYLVYGGVHILFFRAESGQMLRDAQAGTPGWWKLARYAFTTSHHGHYTPFLFGFELVCTLLCRTSEAGWRLRQLSLVALLALALWSLFGRAAVQLSRHRAARGWMAAGLSAPFIFSPLMIDLIGWPMESTLFLWAALTLSSLGWMDRAITAAPLGGHPPARDLAVSLVLGYASLHVLGLGLATMAGWYAAYTVIGLDAWRRHAPGVYRRKLAGLGAVGIALTGIHAFLMAFLLAKTPTALLAARAPVSFLPFAAEVLGFVPCFVGAAVRSLWSPDAWPYPRTDLMAQDWPYGLGLLAALALGGAAGGRALCRAPSAAALRRSCWYAFSVVAFAAFIGLIVRRVYLTGEPWLDYLIGARYLWPGAILLVGGVMSFLMCLRRPGPLLAGALGSILLAGSALGNLVYQRRVVPTVWPYATFSQTAAWQQLVAMTRELHRAGLPLPDLPLNRLTIEFRTALKWYEPGLLRDAGLPPGERLDWVEANVLTPARWSELQSHSPALRAVAPTLCPEIGAALAEGRAPPDGLATTRLTDEASLRAASLDHVKDQPNLGVDIAVDGLKRKSLWIDSPTTVTFHHVRLGKHPVFRAFVAIHPAVYEERGADGAVFEVSVVAEGRASRVAELAVDPFARPEQRRWNALAADLSAFRQRWVDVVVRGSAGPAGNDYADWCIWGDPEVTDE